MRRKLLSAMLALTGKPWTDKTVRQMSVVPSSQAYIEQLTEKLPRLYAFELFVRSRWLYLRRLLSV